METAEFRSLVRHMEWADALIWECLLSVPSLEQDEQVRERLAHYHSTQWAYVQIWRGEPIELPELSTFADLRALRQWAWKGHQTLRTFMEALRDEALHRVVEFPFAELVAERYGSAQPATMSETLLQLALHTAHHRGQVAMQLRTAGGDPPVTDFIAWVWMGRPEPRWDGVSAA